MAMAACHLSAIWLMLPRLGTRWTPYLLSLPLRRAWQRGCVARDWRQHSSGGPPRPALWHELAG